MDIDIGFWLTITVLFSIALWVADRIFKITPASRGEKADLTPTESVSQHPRIVREVVEFFNSILPVLLVVLVVRSFLFEPFTIPSGSMLPTLKVHDFILVNKFAYGVRLPAIHTKVLETGTPARGDVMVFRYPENPAQSYIKRVVGLPGDTVTIRGAELFINGDKVERRLISSTDSARSQEAVYVESLGEVEHLINHQWLLNPYTGQLVSRSPEGEWQVPEGNYFVMGDNRDNSRDSRFWGFVPESHVAGKAVLIWMHWPALFSIPDFSRNGALDKLEAKQ